MSVVFTDVDTTVTVRQHSVHWCSRWRSRRSHSLFRCTFCSRDCQGSNDQWLASVANRFVKSSVDNNNNRFTALWILFRTTWVSRLPDSLCIQWVFLCVVIKFCMPMLVMTPAWSCHKCTRLPVVLKFLKFHRCPEIVLKSAIVLKFYSFGQNVLMWTFVMLSLRHCLYFVLYLVSWTLSVLLAYLLWIAIDISFNQFQCICTSSLSAAFNPDAIYSIFLHFFTSHDYVYVADVECQVMFSLVTFYCFMYNIALLTFLVLQYWSASMNNIYEHRKTCIFCVLSLVKPTKMSWNCPEIF